MITSSHVKENVEKTILWSWKIVATSNLIYYSRIKETEMKSNIIDIQMFSIYSMNSSIMETIDKIIKILSL